VPLTTALSGLPSQESLLGVSLDFPSDVGSMEITSLGVGSNCSGVD